MNRTRKRVLRGAMLLGVALSALVAGGGNALSAQTAEGTVITNVATANYTDANGNTYAAASGSVDVTVAFQGSLDVSSPPTQAPPSPSSGTVAIWTITNNGNGKDQISVVVNSSDLDVAGALRYEYAGNPYANLGDLNTALAAVSDSIPALGSITIDVIYDVGAGEGGNSSNVELIATSTRAGGDANSSITVVTPPVTGGLVVAAGNPAMDRLPSNGTNYSELYSVTSNLTGTATIDLVASAEAPNDATVLIVQLRVDGGAWIPGSSTSVSFITGQVASIEVEYAVNGDVLDAGSNTLARLTATATAVAGTPTANDDHDVTIVAPLLEVSKTVHGSKADAQGNTVSTLAADPLPGDTIWYRVQVTNNGAAAAVNPDISDDLSLLPVTYVAASLDDTGSAPDWGGTLAEAAGEITGNIAGGLAGAGGTAWFVFAVIIN